MKLDAEVAVGSPAEAAELARKAEEYGFDCLWVNETKHDPFVQIALAAASTDRISLGTSIALAFTRSPTTLAYTSYLLAACGGSYTEGVGAVLPCYWIYWEVGKHLLEQGSPDPRYQRWIDTYAGEEFGGEALEVIAVADQLGPGLGAPERARVRQHFRATSRYEWMFWDMGYRREAWPV